MEMHLLPMSPTDSQAHSPCFRDFNTHTVFPNPLRFTSTLCLEVGTLPLPLCTPATFGKTRKTCSGLCQATTSDHQWIQVCGGSQASCYVRQELNICFPRSSLSRLQHSLHCCTNIQLNKTEACIRCMTSWISELDFLWQSSMETEKSH